MMQNRFVVEVLDGVFFNRVAGMADGWWWGSEEEPLQHGPFASSQEALADAQCDAESFKLVIWNHANGWGEDELSPTGHLIVIDTNGRLLVKAGEHPVRANWKPRQ